MLLSIILDARVIEDDADDPIDIQEARKTKGRDDQNGPKDKMPYRMADIEGAVEAADRAAGTIEQLGFVQDGSVEVVRKYDQGQAQSDDRQYDPEDDAADCFSDAERAF